jgi:serine/threonine protein kinase/WD40 repeat protein/tetratricopeptide (TPR) repeat protein
LEAIFDDFESAWKAKERPKIEDFLQRADGEKRSQVFRDLFAIELDRRLAQGEMPLFHEYQERFTEFISDAKQVYRLAMSQGEKKDPIRIPRTTRFQPIDKLGTGGQGEVWLSLDPNMGRRVALKILQPGQQGSERSRSEFIRESEISGKLEHPNIVPVYDVTNELTPTGQVNPDSPCFIMRVFGDPRLHEAVEAFHARPRTRDDYPLLEALRQFEHDRSPKNQKALEQCLGRFPFNPDDSDDQKLKNAADSILRDPSEAGTLDASIKRMHSDGFSTASLRKLLNRFQRICDGMAYAHSRGVIHRDLKPANVMLGEYGETLIADWGLAKVIGRREEDHRLVTEGTLKIPSTQQPGDHTQQGDIKGTLAYMPPEQASGLLDELGPRSDVYSLGAILYCILAGRAPHLGSTISAIRNNEFPTPRSINSRAPKALEAVVLKAMARRPEDRYQTAGELASDVEQWLNDEPVSAWREPVVVRMKRWIRNHQTAAATALATLTMATLAALGWGILERKHTSDMRIETKKAQDATTVAEQNAKKEELAKQEAQAAKERAEQEQRNAIEQKTKAQRLLVGLAESNAGQAMRNGQDSDALSWSVLELKLLQDTPDREEREPVLRQRIGALLDEFPYLEHLIPLDGELIHAQIVGDPEFLVTATVRDDNLRIRTWDITTGQPSKVDINLAVTMVLSCRIEINADSSLLAVGLALTENNSNFRCSFSVYQLQEGLLLGTKDDVGGYPAFSRISNAKKEFEIVQFDSSGEFLIGIKKTPGLFGGLMSEQDQYIQVWDAKTLKQVGQDIKVGKNIGCIKADRGANLLAVVYDTNQIILWDRNKSQDVTPDALRQLLKNRSGSTAPVSLSENGDKISIPVNTNVYLCDTEKTDSPPSIIQLGNRVVTSDFTKDGEHLQLTTLTNQSLLGTNIDTVSEGYAQIWSLKDLVPVSTQTTHQGPVSSLEWYPQLKLMVSGGQDGIVHSRFEFLNNAPFPSLKHAQPLRLASLTQDGRNLITASRDGLVRIWNLDRNALGKSRNGSGLENRISRDPFKQRLPWAKVDPTTPDPQSWDDLATSYEPLARSPDDRWLLTRSRRSKQDQATVGDRLESAPFAVQLWSTTQPQKLIKVIPTALSIDRAEFSPDGKTIALIAGEHPWWNPRRGELPTDQLPRAAPKPASVLFVDFAGNQLSRIDLKGAVGALEFLGRGERLLIGGSDSSYKQGAIGLFDPVSGQRLGEIFKLESPVVDLRCDRDGVKVLATVETQACHALSVSETGLRRTTQLPIGPIVRTAISPDGKLAALGLYTGTIFIYQLTDELYTTAVNPEPLVKIGQESDAEASVIALDFIKDGTTLIATRRDGKILIRDSRTGSAKVPDIDTAREQHYSWVSKDGRRIIAVGLVAGVQLFDSSSGLPVTHFLQIGEIGVTFQEPFMFLPSNDFSSNYIYSSKKGNFVFNCTPSQLEQDKVTIIANLISVDEKKITVPGSGADTVIGICDQFKTLTGLTSDSMQEFAENNPDSAILFFALGREFFEKKSNDSAITYLSKYLESDAGRNDSTAYELRGDAYRRVGRNELASFDYRESARLKLESKNLESASRTLQKILRNDPQFALDLKSVIQKALDLTKRNRGQNPLSLVEVQSNIALTEFVANARLGKWKESAVSGDSMKKKSFYGMMVTKAPVLSVQNDAAIARVYQLAGQEETFKSRCAEMLGNIDDGLGALYQEELANLCVDNPTAIEDLKVLIGAMDKRRSDNQFNAEFLGLLGGLQWRAGLAHESLETLGKSLDYVRAIPANNRRKITEARLMLLIALANQSLGNTAEATKWRDLAEPVYQKEMAEDELLLLQLNKPTLSRLHEELEKAFGSTSTTRKE